MKPNFFKPMKLLPICTLFLFFSTSVVHSVFASDILEVKNLRIEYHENPLGIDVEEPRLSWTLEGEGRNRSQSAYQIVVASTNRILKRVTGIFGTATIGTT